MSTTEPQVQIRPMTFSDLHAMVSIDQKIRMTGTPVPYKEFATHRIFGMNVEEIGPTNRADMLEAAKLIDLSSVAESEGTVCGFIVGRQTYIAEDDIQVGEIAMIGVHPDYRGKGISIKLIDSLCDLFRSKNMHLIRVEADPRDKSLVALLEQSGFSDSHLVTYEKRL